MSSARLLIAKNNNVNHDFARRIIIIKETGSNEHGKHFRVDFNCKKKKVAL